MNVDELQEIQVQQQNTWGIYVGLYNLHQHKWHMDPSALSNSLRLLEKRWNKYFTYLDFFVSFLFILMFVVYSHICFFAFCFVWNNLILLK